MTIKDIASACGVSVSTVSRVLNNRPDVSEDVRKRVRAAFDDYVTKYPDKTILVAAHDAVNKAIICDVLGLGMEHFWQIKQDNTCINVLECNEGVWRTVLLNSTNHMGFLFSGIEQAGL